MVYVPTTYQISPSSCHFYASSSYICITLNLNFTYMNLIGNIIWVVFGGLFLSLGYLFGGLVLCLTIVGIPFGLKVMRLGLFALWPFGGEVVQGDKPMGCLSLLLNVLWIVFGGIEVALGHLTMGVIFCITIIGIPFGLQHFKLMVLALMPFGHEVKR